MHVLEDRKPRHEPRRQRRMSGLVRIDRAKPLLEKAPVDRPGELGERVIDVDDLVEPRPEEIVLSAVPPLLGPHRITLPPLSDDRESHLGRSLNLQDSSPIDRSNRQKRILPNPRKRPKSRRFKGSSRKTR